MKPRLLDLFCGEGGAAAGYAKAGFDVTGVDIERRRRYPFDFIQGDALEADFSGFDVVHASPPCQAYSITKHSHKAKHPELIEPVRARLLASGLLYVIENVPGAPLRDPIVLCGTMFGLQALDTDGTVLWLRRHRLFESSLLLLAPECRCAAMRDRPGHYCGGVYGGGSSDRGHAQHVRRGGYTPGRAQRAALIGADWMTLAGLSQSIPPAYTEHVGRQLFAAVRPKPPAS